MEIECVQVEPVRVAALLTCHNRKNKTLDCLKKLSMQVLPEKTIVETYLVNDGSSDDTGDAVRNQFPFVKVLEGDGNLFWCGGMRMAWGEAMKGDYDYYLWLNDDTHLYRSAIRNLIETTREVRDAYGREGVVVGAICDPDTGKPTYGGVIRIGNTLGFRLVQPTGEPQRCDTINGNCVLIPRAVMRVVGNMSPEFTQWIGDTDYGLRVCAEGFSCWVTSRYVGTCRTNPNGCRWADPSLSLRERLKLLYSPKGLPPREWVTFARRHAGIRWPHYWLKLHLRVLFPKLWVWFGREFEPSEETSS